MKTLATLLAVLALACAARAADVFSMPQVFPRHQRLVMEFQRAIRAGSAEDMEAIARAGTALLPEDPTWRYNLACALSVQMKTDEALEVLERAIRLGFHDSKQISADADLASIHANPRFDELLRLADELSAEPPPHKPFTVNAKNEAWVGPSNTVWNFTLGAFDTYFLFPTNHLASSTNNVVNFPGPAGEAVRKWFKEGTAAGNIGDLYDNRDGGHSHIERGQFPFVTWTRYGAGAKERQYHRIPAVQFFFYGPNATIGNSSTATVDGPYWRCNGRSLLTDPHAMSQLAFAHFRNQLYIYPALRDFEGDSDHLPANNPYFLLSKGASWSDKPFMHAFFLSLAAMQPETKKFLSEKGIIAPILQWAFRVSQKGVDPADPETFMCGAAHPPVFDGSVVSPSRMVSLCHTLTTNSLPPIVFVEVLEEEVPQRDENYVDHFGSEVLFTTPQAIARVARRPQRMRRMVVGADKSMNLNGKPLKWHWRLLCGDPEKVKITPLDEQGSKAEIIVDFHERFPVAPGGEMLGSRVDIGVFADNGEYISAPAFVSFCFPANEIRTYTADGQIQTIDGQNGSRTYADPMIFPARKWIDIFHYDSEKNLTGWTRMRGIGSEHFTANGQLIEKTDDLGRPLVTRSVVYRPVAGPQNTIELEEAPGPVRWTFSYDGDDDDVGFIVNREIVQPARAAGNAAGAAGGDGGDE